MSRQAHRETAPLALSLTRNLHASLVKLRQTLDQRETQPNTAGRRVTRVGQLREGLEYPLHLF